MRTVETHYMNCRRRLESYTYDPTDSTASVRERILLDRDVKQARYACKLAGWGWARNARPYNVRWTWEDTAA
jgi:hypothetical protein